MALGWYLTSSLLVFFQIEVTVIPSNSVGLGQLASQEDKVNKAPSSTSDTRVASYKRSQEACWNDCYSCLLFALFSILSPTRGTLFRCNILTQYMIKQRQENKPKWKDFTALVQFDGFICTMNNNRKNAVSFVFWPCRAACRIFVLQLGTEPRPLAVKLQVLTIGPPGNSQKDSLPTHLYFGLHCLKRLDHRDAIGKSFTF